MELSVYYISSTTCVLDTESEPSNMDNDRNERAEGGRLKVQVPISTLLLDYGLPFAFAPKLRKFLIGPFDVTGFLLEID